MPHEQILVDGRAYHCESEDSRWKGFGGRRFTVRFHDGREVKTSNLWLDYAVKNPGPDNADLFEGWEKLVRVSWKWIGDMQFLVPKGDGDGSERNKETAVDRKNK
jgi:hypothetical protein